MKKLLIKIFVIVITFVAINTSLYCRPFDRLGNYKTSVTEGFNQNTGQWIATDYFENGIIIYGFGEPIIYLYGSDDLPGEGKRSIETIANNKVTNFDENVQVYLYEATDIASQHTIQTKILNRGEEFSIQNSNLNLEKGKLYIIVFCNEKGTVLKVKKIMPA